MIEIHTPNGLKAYVPETIHEDDTPRFNFIDDSDKAINYYNNFGYVIFSKCIPVDSCIQLKDLWDKKMVYQGFRVMPYSTACGTPLSNFEANSNYKKVNEESVIVKFKSKDKDFSFLVWTTTPWTLPSNMALCVNPEYSYSVYELEDEKYLICDTLVKNVFGIGKKMKLPKNLDKINLRLYSIKTMKISLTTTMKWRL